MVREADVVWSLKQHLQEEGLSGHAVSDIAVDSDGSYRASAYASRLEPMMSLCIGGFYPDLVCNYEGHNENGVAAFEVKASFGDWVKGITQARAYQEGVHRAYLALPFKKNSRLAQLERDARKDGVGIWFLRDGGWHEGVAPSLPRPNLGMTHSISAALRGIVLPRRLKLNHPLNYLTAVYLRATAPDMPLQDAPAQQWGNLRTRGTRQHAISGAHYLGLLVGDDQLTRRGLVVADLMKCIGYRSDQAIDRRKRLCEASPGLATIVRTVLVEQETTKLVVGALESGGNARLNTVELLRVAQVINAPLAAGLLLLDPQDIEREDIAVGSFSPSFVYQFKQILWHAGILATKIHATAGKGAHVYRHAVDFWQLEERWLLS